MWTVHNNQLIALTCGQCGQLVWILSTMSTTGRKELETKSGSLAFVDNMDNVDKSYLIADL